MISPKIEESRIRKALRDCEERGLQVYEAQECIKKAVQEFGDSLVVACSFGGCSVATLHMALQINPKIRVVFNNTGVEYPETYAYRDHLVEEWDLQLIETKPIKSFWRCVKEYGLPKMRITKGIPNPGKPFCCKFLKDLPMRNLCKGLDIKAELTGLRAAESRARMFAIGQVGQFYYEKKRMRMWKIHPVAFWKRQDVFDYFARNGLPLNPLYSKGFDRTGCMPCTSFKSWRGNLAKANPKLYRYIQKLRGVSLIDDFLTFEEQAFNECNQVSPNKKQAFLEEWF